MKNIYSVNLIYIKYQISNCINNGLTCKLFWLWTRWKNKYSEYYSKSDRDIDSDEDNNNFEYYEKNNDDFDGVLLKYDHCNVDTRIKVLKKKIEQYQKELSKLENEKKIKGKKN